MRGMRRIHITISVFLFLLAGLAPAARCDDYTGASVTVVKKAAITADGRKMEYLKTERPEVTALLVEIGPGKATGWHFHPVPVYAYVISGVLTAEMESGERHDYKEGEAIFEAVGTPHNGMNLGKVPVKLIVFYTGEEDKPVTVKISHK